MKQQHEAGKIFSGPTPDHKLGNYVIRAVSRQEAEKIAARSIHGGGFSAFDLIEWEVHQFMGMGPFTAAELRVHK